jgi:hypothetical protein
METYSFTLFSKAETVCWSAAESATLAPWACAKATDEVGVSVRQHATVKRVTRPARFLIFFYLG